MSNYDTRRVRIIAETVGTVAPGRTAPKGRGENSIIINDTINVSSTSGSIKKRKSARGQCEAFIRAVRATVSARGSRNNYYIYTQSSSNYTFVRKRDAGVNRKHTRTFFV